MALLTGRRTRAARWSVRVAGAGALGLLLLGSSARTDERGVGGDVRVEFAAPASWRCETSAPCTVCRNIDAVEAEVVIWPGGDQPPEYGRVSSGAILRICPPEDDSA